MVNSLIDSGGNMYLSVDSFKKIDYIKTGSFNITLRKVNVFPQRFDKMYLDKELIENKLYQITNQFDERQIISIKFYLELLIKTHPFNGVNGITCKILYSNHDKLMKGLK